MRLSPNSDESYSCQHEEDTEQGNTYPLERGCTFRSLENQVIDRPAIYQRIRPNSVPLLSLDFLNEVLAFLARISLPRCQV